MKYNLVVSTHHKTGTVWMDGVFKAIAADLGVPFIDYNLERDRLGDRLSRPFVLLNDNSDFSRHPELLERDDVRVLHLIRDPRDILISAMHYHKHAKESWLHEPGPRYLGTTYQRMLRCKPSKFEQYVFEMENSTACTLHNLRDWQYGRLTCFEARYEDLRQDTDFGYWRRILDFLGLEGPQQDNAVRHFWQNSLFGGLSRFGNKHVRSGDIAQWKREFDIRLGYAFLERFPGLLQTLDYEPDVSWLLDLPRAEPVGVASRLGFALAGSLVLFTLGRNAVNP